MNRVLWVVVLCLALCGSGFGEIVLKVSDNGRFFTDTNGRPFFYLADTAWELFHRPALHEAQQYLDDRAAKGFTVIQAVVLAEFAGLVEPNPNGDLPLSGNDPTKPNEAYFEHVDQIVDYAASRGLVIGMLPTWGDKWNKKWGMGPEIFTPENALVYGRFIGKRYADKPIIWILGGDRPIENDTHLAIIRAMAKGIEEGDGGKHLMTFHTWGGNSAAQWLHNEPWYDFNMWQTGHDRNRPSWELIQRDYDRSPAKPVLDGEPGYEDHAAGFNMDNGYLDDYDARKSLYWSLFAGSSGHTYGCHAIWQFGSPKRPLVNFTRRGWIEGKDLPGAFQMQYGRKLMLSRPYLTRVPDQSLILSENKGGTHHVQATRDQAASYAMVYIPSQQQVKIDLAKLAAKEVVAYWYDVRNGSSVVIGRFGNGQPREFTPPTGGPDWVLVIDDASRAYPPPGSTLCKETL